MSSKVQNKKKLQKFTAQKRIINLFELAEKKARVGDFEFANRYVEIARKISMRSLVPIPREYKQNFCSYCNSYFLQNRTCRTRIHRGKIIIFCNSCKKYTRIPLK